MIAMAGTVLVALASVAEKSWKLSHSHRQAILVKTANTVFRGCSSFCSYFFSQRFSEGMF